MAFEKAVSKLLSDPATRCPDIHESLRAWRPYVLDKAVVASLQLAVMRSLPHPSTPFNLRRTDRIGVTHLEEGTFIKACYRSGHLTNVPIETVKNELEQYLPSYSWRSLGNICVKDIVQIGPQSNPSLALQLQAPLLEHEAECLLDGLEEISGTHIEAAVNPHLSIANFPGINEIPEKIIHGVSEVAPKQITLKSLQIEMFRFE